MKIIKKVREKNKNSKVEELKVKSQAAMEYLMTYGWAILIIALSLVVLYSLGIMNPKNFIPRAPPGSCFVFRPNGPGTTDFVSLQGTCGYLPMYVGSFDGVDAYVEVPNSASLQIVGDLTISFWIYLNNLNNNMVPVDKSYSGEYFVKIYTSGYLTFAQGASGNFEELTVLPAGSVVTGSWIHLAVVRTTTNTKLLAYKNGVVGSPVTYSKTPTATAQPLDIGMEDRRYNPVNGLIANVQIYNTALTQQEIQYLYQQGLGGGPVRLQNLVGWWPLNGDGTINAVTFVQNYNPP